METFKKQKVDEAQKSASSEALIKPNNNKTQMVNHMLVTTHDKPFCEFNS